MKMLRNSRGFSLMEMLVVVAIIGVLSLVTIPAFMNFQRRNAVRAGLRSFTGDVRACRQAAITRNVYVRIQFESARDYAAFQSKDFGKTWEELKLGAVDSGTSRRTLPNTLQFSANTYTDSTDDDKMLDIDFRPDGTVGDFTATEVKPGTVTLRSEWKDILGEVVVDISTTGQIKTTEKKL